MNEFYVECISLKWSVFLCGVHVCILEFYVVCVCVILKWSVYFLCGVCDECI